MPETAPGDEERQHRVPRVEPEAGPAQRLDTRVAAGRCPLCRGKRPRNPAETLADPHGQLCTPCWRVLHCASETMPLMPGKGELARLQAMVRGAGKS